MDVACLIGDVVASRAQADQRGLLEAVAARLAATNESVEGLQPLTLTVGDEFQGSFATLAPALTAAVRLRLPDDPDVAPPDLRLGIGLGPVVDTEVAPAPRGQSGAGWWAARAALDAVRDREGRSQWPRSLRSAVRVAEGSRREEGTIDGLLVCIDELLGRLDTRERWILRAALDGRRQADVAATLGISQPAVARRLHDKGIHALVRALELAAGPAA